MSPKKRDRQAQEMAEWMAELAHGFSENWIGTYVLDDAHNPVPVSTIGWGRWMQEDDHKRVALTQTELHEVSTVFLGLDHSFGGKKPVLFETMVFGRNVVDIRTGKRSGIEHDMDRYCTWDEAVAGHEAMVAKVIAYEKGQSPEENDA